MIGPIHSLAETGSTNDALKALAASGAPEGSWVRADRQTAGRGRLGRRWMPVEGNLFASTLVRRRPGDPQAPSLALVAAVALDEVLAGCFGVTRVAIKWPNDVLVDGAKLSGILLEAAGDAVIVGIGVNLAGHPQIDGRAVTSFPALGLPAPDPAQFLELLATVFARWLGAWRDGGLGPIRARWQERAHPPGTAMAASAGAGERIEGLYQGLTEDGALTLRTADGATRVIHAADVFLLRS